MTVRVFAMAIVFALALTAPVSAQDIMRGYRAMSFPQANVPIGARWIPSVGPSGDGAPAENITVSRGLQSSILSQSTKASIVAALGSYLGLTSNLARTNNSTFTELEVHRVKDIAAVRNVRAGEQLLSQAIRAGTISIVTDEAGAAELVAKAEAKGLPTTATITAGGGRRVQLDGSNLFIAYQVVELTQPAVRNRTIHHDGKELVVDRTWRFRFCQCTSRDLVDIEIQNLQAPFADGTYETTRISYDPERHRLNEYALPAYRDGNNVTAARVVFAYRARQMCFTHADGSPACFPSTFDRPDNYIRLTTSRFQVRLVQNPSGTL